MNFTIHTLARDVLLVAISVAASSMITYRVSRVGAKPDVVRATRVELVDSSGRIVAALESVADADAPRSTRLRFMDRNGQNRIELGLRFNSESPYVLMTGHDKRPRISIGVDLYGNPALNMSDHQWDGRLLLGTFPGDKHVLGPLEDWGLYVNPGRRDNYASVWVSGEWHSRDERAGVIARSAQKPNAK